MHLKEILPVIIGISTNQIKATLKLLDEGASIPFISRYRKEQTGSLDEVKIEEIKTIRDKLVELTKRKEVVLKSIKEQGKLDSVLKKQIDDCEDITELEDIYLPYKPKKKTRASIARKKGLEPLAKILMNQFERDVYSRALMFVKGEVSDAEEALAGARDIIAEWINESPRIRKQIRSIFNHDAIVSSKIVKGKDEEGIKYKDYFSYEEKLNKIPSHRLLAIRRAEREGFLKISVSPNSDNAIKVIEKSVVKGSTESSNHVKLAVKDSYKRLLSPSIETEFLKSSKEKADKEAIKVFSNNLRQLMMSSPLGQKQVLAIDPGFRSGCKVVCLNKQGDLLHNETIYPHKPQEQKSMAMKKISNMVSVYKIEAIAIGNGTASRETEAFIKRMRFDRNLQVFIVSEDGASVYSASAVAREEFPEYDVTVRGAVSIGRRLMDPMAELVKIDPKSIGVGQYQHDVDQNMLRESLSNVVINTVNRVGVDLNTASKHLLSYISGLGPQLAENVIEYRKENGAFTSRKQLLNVKRMGAKSYEQCAGFLRIQDAKNPLDNSAVHPESYKIVEKMSKDFNCSVLELMQSSEIYKQIIPENYISDKIGLPTITDILKELDKPGRDPRKKAKVFEFAKGIRKIEDLHEGIILPGIVTNITNFGAFVDIGVKQDGLVHISNLADKFVSNPADIVYLHQHVQVRVIEVDIVRKRIQLSMKDVVEHGSKA